MISLFLPVSMTTGRYAVWLRGRGVFFAANTTIQEHFTIHPDNQAEKENDNN